MQQLETSLYSFIGSITGVLTGIGVVVCILGIVVGGLMRATAFGNEMKVMRSNQAIACAVVGLVIVLLAQVAAGAISSFFPQ
jgi:hypothetical protein